MIILVATKKWLGCFFVCKSQVSWGGSWRCPRFWRSRGGGRRCAARASWRRCDRSRRGWRMTYDCFYNPPTAKLVRFMPWGWEGGYHGRIFKLELMLQPSCAAGCAHELMSLRCPTTPHFDKAQVLSAALFSVVPVSYQFCRLTAS